MFISASLMFTIQLINWCQLSTVLGIGPVHEQIIHWWNKVSVQKPLKCTLNPSYLQPFDKQAKKYLDNLVWKPILFSEPCLHDDVNEEPYLYKGKYNSDGVFEGPAKLKLKMNLGSSIVKRYLGELKNENKTCIRQNSSKKIAEVVGTFKNGYLQGTAKVKFTDNTTLISHFERSNPVGKQRSWTKSDNLDHFFYREGKTKSIAWAKLSDYLIGMNQSFIRDDEYSSSYLLVPLDISKEILIGNVNIALGYAENIHNANISITSKEEECFMHFDWEVKEKKNFKLIFNGEKSIQIPDSTYETDPLCKKGQQSNGSMPEQKFKIWEELIDDQQSLNFKTLYHMKPDISPIDPTKVKQKFLSSDMTYFSDGPNIHVNMSVWEGPISTWKVTMDGFDTQDKLHGFCQFNLLNNFVNHTGKHDFLEWSLEHISGNFVHGKLQGIGYLVTWRGVQIFATFKDGEMHGPVSALGKKFLYDVEKRGFGVNNKQNNNQRLSLKGKSGSHYIGYFKNGQAVGNFWIGLVNNGFMHGMVDEMGQVTGDNLVFIYPDGITALKGRFENTYMKNARNVEVKEYHCDENGLLFAADFTEPLSNYRYFYDPSTNESWGAGNSKDIQDPYDLKNVKLSQSLVPNSGEGVFSKRFLPKQKPACFYSMYLFNEEQLKIFGEQCTHNTSKSTDYRRHCKKYSIGFSTYHGIIDIFPELDVNPLPNLGPKVNHHFRSNNCAYMETDHPVWGMIQSVTPLSDIQADTELFTNYGYGKQGEFPGDFPWYYETKLLIEREERLKEKEKEKNSQNITTNKKKKKQKKNKSHSKV